MRERERERERVREREREKDLERERGGGGSEIKQGGIDNNANKDSGTSVPCRCAGG